MKAWVHTGVAFCLIAILTGLPVVLCAQQEKPEDKAQTVDMKSFRVNTPGGGWKITAEKEKGHVLLEKKQTGLLRSMGGLAQDATIDVYEIRPPLEAWCLTEEQLASRINKETEDVQGGQGRLVGIEQSLATVKDKTFHVLGFTISPPEAGMAPWVYVHYLYFPAQYGKRHVLYNFAYAHAQSSMAAMVDKMKVDPLLSVIDSLQIVDPLSSVGGDPGELLRAAVDGNNAAITGLLDRGVDVNVATPQGTALSLAALFGRRETVDLLISRGADVNKADTDAGVAPLSCAIMGGERQIAGTLIDKGTDLGAKTRAGYTALTFAAAMGQEELTRTLIEKGADVNAGTSGGLTPIYYSASAGHIAIVTCLLDHGADINAQGSEGETPLMAAIQEQHLDVTGLLLDKGADVNKSRPNGWTPIFSAADAGSLAITKKLVEKGADINAQTKDSKRTPLIESLIADQNDIAQFLIERGANVNAKTMEGYTALKIAKAKKMDNIVGLLKKAGAK